MQNWAVMNLILQAPDVSFDYSKIKSKSGNEIKAYIKYIEKNTFLLKSKFTSSPQSKSTKEPIEGFFDLENLIQRNLQYMSKYTLVLIYEY